MSGTLTLDMLDNVLASMPPLQKQYIWVGSADLRKIGLLSMTLGDMGPVSTPLWLCGALRSGEIYVLDEKQHKILKSFGSAPQLQVRLLRGWTSSNSEQKSDISPASS